MYEQSGGGSPASTTLSSGIQTTELSEMCTDSEISPSSSGSTPDCLITAISTDNIEDSSQTQDIEEILPSTVVQERRSLQN